MGVTVVFGEQMWSGLKEAVQKDKEGQQTEFLFVIFLNPKTLC